MMTLEQKRAKATALGYTDEQIDAYLAKQGSAPADRSRVGSEPFAKPDTRREMIGTLPMAGGLVGGALAGIPGATLGGMAGAAAKQGLLEGMGYPHAEGLHDVGMSVLGSGAEQGLLETGGKMLSGPVKWAGDRFMQHAVVRPSGALRAEFPKAMETINRERFNVGSAERPSWKGRAARTQAGRKLNALLDRAGAQGKWKAGQGYANLATDFAPEVSALIRDVSVGPHSTERAAALHDMFNQFVADNPGRLSPKTVKVLKKTFRDEGKAVVALAGADKLPSGAQPLAARYNAAIGDAGQRLNAEIPGAGKEIAAQNAKTQNIIGAQKMIRAAERRNAPRIPIPLGPPGELLNTLLGIGTNPQTLSRLRYAATSPVLMRPLEQVPRALVGLSSYPDTTR